MLVGPISRKYGNKNRQNGTFSGHTCRKRVLNAGFTQVWPYLRKKGSEIGALSFLLKFLFVNKT